MTSSATKPGVCLGFLTIVEHAELGCVGGYLLLNAAGRPLEFHCTAPVTANRTQQILYGPTLKPYVYGEVIGQALLAKSKLQPIVVCTDCEPVLAAREFTQFPMVLVSEHEGGRESLAKNDRPSGATLLAKDSRSLSLSLPNSRVLLAPGWPDDEHVIRSTWPSAADYLDLLEPFTRIREALHEAQQAGRRAA